MILKLNKIQTNMKKSALMLTIFISVLLFGIFVLMSMLILQFPTLSLEAKRYTGLIGFYGMLISDTAVILSYLNITKKDSKMEHKAQHNEELVNLIAGKKILLEQVALRMILLILV